MADPTRPLPNLVPQPDGSWSGRTVLTPTSFTTRGLFTLPPARVVPVIVVPGIMGTNLRAATSPRRQANEVLNPGEAAWRAPNGSIAGVTAARLWKGRAPATRQRILDGATLEVDSRGQIDLPLEARNYGMTEAEVRARRWGEVHWNSYGRLLYGLQVGLNHSFEMDPLDNVRVVCRHWQAVMAADPAQWGVRAIDAVTEAELERHARFFYPVYAFGYNWLDSCDVSAKVLRERIESTIAFWTQHRRACSQVILVTHSMGGLVARACARQIPAQVLGVIHGAMPALGAPACYRRIACGTETSSPASGRMANAESACVADILGDRPEATMPVMAVSPGALQLLPNHLYPQPWLQVCMLNRVNQKDVSRDLARLPNDNPYDLYRDMRSWYRLVDPGLVDPAGKYLGGAAEAGKAVRTAIDGAERFHRATLGDYYHPCTYAFYGADPAHLAYGAVRWVARDPGAGAVFTDANVRGAAPLGYGPVGARRVRVEGRIDVEFAPSVQDAGGDGTVPARSGAAPGGHALAVFALRGFDHQQAFNHEPALLLTHHLIVKLVQKLP